MELVVVTLAVVKAGVDSSINEVVIEAVVESVFLVMVEVIDSSLIERVAFEEITRIAVLLVNIQEDGATDDEPGQQASASTPTADKATSEPTMVLKDMSTSKTEKGTT